MASSEKIRLISPTGRFIWPGVVTAEAYTPPGGGQPGKPSFRTTMMFEPDDLKKFQMPDESGSKLIDVNVVDIAVGRVKAMWPEETDIPSFIKALNMTKMWPFQDGTKLADDPKSAGKNEFARGKKLIKANSSENIAPNLFVMEKGNPVQLRRDVPSDVQRAKSLFTGGNYGYLELDCVANSTPQRYVKFYLVSVVFVKTGERIGGGGSLIGKFSGINGGVDTETDVTKGMTDEIPY